MRKFGLIAAIVGFGILGLDLLLRALAHLGSWLWLPGTALLCGGSGLYLWARGSSAAPVIRAPKAPVPIGTDTARILDNFEQRFAELKGRKASDTVAGDLYALGTQLERRGRAMQATAVYRHLARIDNTYRDVAARLRRLVDAERSRSATAATPAAAAARAPAPIRASEPAAATTATAKRPAGPGPSDSAARETAAIPPSIARSRSRPSRLPANSAIPNSPTRERGSFAKRKLRGASIIPTSSRFMMWVRKADSPISPWST